MAQKRMFSKDVISNDNFIEMPDSSQNLYFHLSMNADDDGFISNYKSVMRMLGKKEDDLKVLIAKQFLIPFENGLLVIRHWKLNNYIQKDRYKETIFKDEKAKLTLDNSNVYNLDTECIHSIDKNSIDKISLDISSNSLYDFVEENFGRTLSSVEYEEISKWEDNDLTRYAIKQAILNSAYSIKYINTILSSYKKKNIQTVQQAQEDEKKFKASKDKPYKQVPEWFDKKIEKEELTIEEQEAMKEMLKEFKE